MNKQLLKKNMNSCPVVIKDLGPYGPNGLS